MDLRTRGGACGCDSFLSCLFVLAPVRKGSVEYTLRKCSPAYYLSRRPFSHFVSVAVDNESTGADGHGIRTGCLRGHRCMDPCAQPKPDRLTGCLWLASRGPRIEFQSGERRA